MKWTFGIITHGPTNHYIQKVIDSILLQKIDKDCFEIVVIGGEPPNRGEYHVPFDDLLHSNWITKKKNLVAENAMFENLVITHDYVQLMPGWYENFEAFGEDWDVCMNRILNTDNRRFRDWVSYDAPTISSPWVAPEFIPYSDHSRTNRMYVSGTYFCVKRNFLCKNRFDENRRWGQSEDVEWSCRLRENWNYRCNPKSGVQFMKHKLHFPEPKAKDEYDPSNTI